jgi:hypothetical protein
MMGVQVIESLPRTLRASIAVIRKKRNIKPSSVIYVRRVRRLYPRCG